MARRRFNPDTIIARIETVLSEEIQQVGAAILTNVVLSTPVGDPTLWQNPNSAPPGYAGGHARRNWNVGINSIDDVEVGGIDPTGLSTIGEGQAEIELVDLNDTLNITHAVPYAQRLNRGWSLQAPEDYVESAVDIALNSQFGGREVI